jgi:hypothetical protein
VHAAVDTLGHLLALRVSPANEGERKQVEKLAEGYKKRPKRTSSSPPNMASGSKWPSTRRPSAASCSCRGGGW